MTEKQVYPRPKKSRPAKPLSRWLVIYRGLYFEGGSMSWLGRHRTYLGARIAAWWHYRINSYGGGSVTIEDTRNSGPSMLTRELLDREDRS